MLNFCREIEELRAPSNAEITYSQEQDCSTEVIKVRECDPNISFY